MGSTLGRPWGAPSSPPSREPSLVHSRQPAAANFGSSGRASRGSRYPQRAAAPGRSPTRRRQQLQPCSSQTKEKFSVSRRPGDRRAARYRLTRAAPGPTAASPHDHGDHGDHGDLATALSAGSRATCPAPSSSTSPGEPSSLLSLTDNPAPTAATAARLSDRHHPGPVPKQPTTTAPR